jgi:hypothetical protein
MFMFKAISRKCKLAMFNKAEMSAEQEADNLSTYYLQFYNSCKIVSMSKHHVKREYKRYTFY